MALYTITHSCGHTTETQIYGTNVRGARERKAVWWAEQPCHDCRERSRTQVNPVDRITVHESIRVATATAGPNAGQLAVILTEVADRKTDAKWWHDMARHDATAPTGARAVVGGIRMLLTPEDRERIDAIRPS